jgi:hypothetical protein
MEAGRRGLRSPGPRRGRSLSGPPAVVRRDGMVLADGWLPDFVRLGELERHPGDGVIQAAASSGRRPCR